MQLKVCILIGTWIINFCLMPMADISGILKSIVQHRFLQHMQTINLLESCWLRLKEKRRNIMELPKGKVALKVR